MPYHVMTPEQRAAFLRAPVRAAIVSTTRADGRPHAAPVWIELDGDDVVFNTGADTLKGKNLARDPRLTICVQDDQPPFSFVSMEGTAELIDDLEQVQTWAARIGGRYMGADRAEEYGARNGVAGELLVRVHVDKALGLADVSD